MGDLQKALKEKEEAFSNFEREGQVLAKKQSDMQVIDKFFVSVVLYKLFYYLSSRLTSPHVSRIYHTLEKCEEE